MSMAMLRRLLVTAMLSGLVAGVILTGIQRLQISGLIQQAELYEQATGQEALAAASRPHGHEDTVAAHERSHPAAEWEPKNGLERIAFTALANVIMAVGFGLFMAAAIAISGKRVSGPKGLLWGLAGYCIFFLAPSLGLPPELPGTQAAPLADRQLWWLMTATLTAGGMALLVFAPPWFAKAIGVALLVAPHISGAPHLAAHDSLAPEELSHSFIYASAVANAIFWLILGGLTGFLYRRLAAVSDLSQAYLPPTRP